MNWNFFLIRLVASPLIFGLLTITYLFALIKHFISFMRYGGELVTFVDKNKQVTLMDIYRTVNESIKTQKDDLKK